MRIKTLFIALALLATGCGPRRSPEERIPRIEQVVTEGMKAYEVPGVSIAVIEGGRIEWARGYGVKEAGKPDPITPETMFQAGSISKPVAALVALRFVQEGRLDLDEDVNAKLLSWHVPENELTSRRKVTLRGLLSHSAGLNVHGFPGYEAGAEVPTMVQVLDGGKPANTEAVRVVVLPGTEWRYSGGGYTILQQLLVDVSQHPFAELMRGRVFEPLGLRHSTYEQPLPASFASAAATAHVDGQPIAGRWHTYPEMAAAGLWTTPTDLARIALEIQRELAGRSDKILSPASARRMVKPQMADWGLGLRIEEKGRTARFSHGGIDEGFESYWIATESTGQGAVVMTNSRGGLELAMDIVRAIANEYGWPK